MTEHTEEPNLADRLIANEILSGLLLRTLAIMSPDAGEQIARALEETAVKFDTTAPGVAVALRDKAAHGRSGNGT